MVIVAQRNILLPSADRSKVFPVTRGWMGEVPDWASSTPYFRELVADGKIIVSASRRDRDLQNAHETGVEKTRLKRKRQRRNNRWITAG
mgnify:CR=1 FL=1